MKIEQTTLKPTFDELDVGDVFIYGGDVYLKVETKTITKAECAVNLKDGMILVFASFAEVQPAPSAKLVI